MPIPTNRYLSNLRLFALLLVPLTVIPILAGWVGDISKAWFDGKLLSNIDFWLFYGGLVGILIFAGGILFIGRKLLPIDNIEETDVAPRRVLIALLSPCPNLTPPGPDEDASSWRVQDQGKTDIGAPLTGLSLDKVIDPKATLPDGGRRPTWRWQQTLRAAHHHGDKLKRLVLIGSLDGSGTNEQLQLADRFFSYYFPGKVHILGSPKGADEDFDSHWQADFEKLDDIRRLLLRAIKELRRAPNNYTDKDIIIDCTGGFKTASIACALVTFDRPDLMFQYVGTGKRTGKILGYNVVTEARGG